MIHQTIHTGAFNHMKGSQKGGTLPVADVSDSFHLYAMEWLPDGLRFFIDDTEVFHYQPTDFATPVTAEEWPFGEKPFSLILNVAYGGGWGGAMGTDDTTLPAVMEIDYVRVYEKA
jgi:beta-glucanase (GH16 family)